MANDFVSGGMRCAFMDILHLFLIIGLIDFPLRPVVFGGECLHCHILIDGKHALLGLGRVVLMMNNGGTGAFGHLLMATFDIVL